MMRNRQNIQKIALIAFAAISAPVLNAAGPVMHIYCAELFFYHCRPHYTEKQQEAFIRGTLFPDIRYIAGLPRSSTHLKKVTLDHICAESDPFKAGMLFHAYVDDQRAHRAWGAKMHRLVQYQNQKNSHLLKLIEDELCYHMINIPRTQRALSNFYSSELQPGVRCYHALLYQSNLSDYFSQSPLQLFKTRAQTKRGYLLLSLNTVQDWATLIDNYQKNDRVILYVQALLSEFKQLISTYVQKKLAQLPSYGTYVERYFRAGKAESKNLKKMLDTYPTL
jgi:hypothetical protein